MVVAFFLVVVAFFLVVVAFFSVVRFLVDALPFEPKTNLYFSSIINSSFLNLSNLSQSLYPAALLRLGQTE